MWDAGKGMRFNSHHKAFSRNDLGQLKSLPHLASHIPHPFFPQRLSTTRQHRDKLCDSTKLNPIPVFAG